MATRDKELQDMHLWIPKKLHTIIKNLAKREGTTITQIVVAYFRFLRSKHYNAKKLIDENTSKYDHTPAHVQDLDIHNAIRRQFGPNEE